MVYTLFSIAQHCSALLSIAQHSSAFLSIEIWIALAGIVGLSSMLSLVTEKNPIFKTNRWRYGWCVKVKSVNRKKSKEWKFFEEVAWFFWLSHTLWPWFTQKSPLEKSYIWLHCKPLQSNCSGTAVKNLLFEQKCSPLTVISLEIFHCNNGKKKFP